MFRKNSFRRTACFFHFIVFPCFHVRLEKYFRLPGIPKNPFVIQPKLTKGAMRTISLRKSAVVSTNAFQIISIIEGRGNRLQGTQI